MINNYRQAFGRPHKGLSDPAAYGLTYAEVVEIVDSGQWKNFCKKFYYERDRTNKITRKKYICHVCKIQKTNLDDWNKGGTRCKDCQGKRPGVMSKRQRRPETKSYLCGYCKGPGGCKNLLGRRVCITCLKNFKELLGKMNETQG